MKRDETLLERVAASVYSTILVSLGFGLAVWHDTDHDVDALDLLTFVPVLLFWMVLIDVVLNWLQKRRNRE